MVELGTAEYGEVIDFYVRHGYGFLYALTPQGERTGELLIFYYDEGEFRDWDSDGIVFTGRVKKLGQALYELHTPWRGLTLVLERTRRFGRDDYRAKRWGYANQADELAEQPEVEIHWQIASYLSESDGSQQTLLSVVLSGIRRDTYEGVPLWTAVELGFTNTIVQKHQIQTVLLDVPDPDRDIIYWLEVYERGGWHKRVSITPITSKPE